MDPVWRGVVNGRQSVTSASTHAWRLVGAGCGSPALRPCRPRGFTLIEIAVVIAVIAILVSVALPSYSSSVIRLNRTSAERFMLDVANREEQYMMDARSYTATIGTGGLGVTPEVDIAVRYTFAVAVTGNDCTGAALAGPSFVITATAIGGQASDGNLCLDSRNNRTPAGKWER
jgi:type IV pilus assembly protein PilE